MSAARMVAVAVRDPGALLRLRGIDPRVGRTHVNALGMGLDPGTQSRHWSYIGREAGRFRQNGRKHGTRRSLDHGHHRSRDPAHRPHLASDQGALEPQRRVEPSHRSRHARALSRGGSPPARGDRRPLSDLPPVVERWFESKGWNPRRHQLEMLERAKSGRSALLVAATGAGKTLAGFLPTICELAEAPAEGLHTLYVSPLKALAVDVQRNLIGPIEEMGLPIRVETRTGDTPSDRKARQRVRPPQVLLTTPESLSLLLSYPESVQMFENLRTIVVDELHAFAKEKRGDLLSLSMARLQKLAPGMRRVGLSATISDPDAYRSWLAPDADMELVDVVLGEPGAEPDLSILIPENKIPWGGHSGYHAIADVMRLLEQHKTTLVFSNTRGLAELIFQKLWDVNEQALPIGIHHGSLSVEARRKVEAAMAASKLRGLVATASLDLGIDWGDIDCVIQMGAPKGSSRLLQRIGRANHRMDEPSKAIVIPGNRFEYLEAQAAWDAVMSGERDADDFR